MTKHDPFQLEEFMPYLLNRAAETTSLEFQKTYKETYGMLRTEWRVLFHLGRYGELTAKQICDKSDLHKTKVSRAVSALEAKRFLKRTQVPTDRRHELLSPTKQGQSAFAHLQAEAVKYNERLMSAFTPEEQEIAKRCMKMIANLA
ncbi:MAG: MarR family transcriptional regulator [Sulfitobacter sp.]